MRLLLVVLLLCCCFAGGIFFGIHMDYAARHLHASAGRVITYQVQNYARANIEVAGGDEIKLEPPPGGNKSGLAFKWTVYSPCKSGSTATDCVIDPNGVAGPYFFTCASNAGYSCPDPGVQQSPVPVPDHGGYAWFVKTDFAYLLGVAQSNGTHSGDAVQNGHPAATSETAFVGCSNGSTTLTDLNGNPLPNPLPVSKGETVFWVSSRLFSLNTSKFPASLCTNGNPPGTNQTEAQCDVAANAASQSYTYSVTAQSTTSCSPASAALAVQ